MDIVMKTPKQMLDTVHYVARKVSKQYFRDGIPLEKGAIITPQRIEKNMELYKTICQFWSIYPDAYVEMITPVDSKFKLKFFQVIFLRACLRHGRILTVAPRAAGKSFICILALMLICAFRPHSTVFICSPGKQQSAKIGAQKIKQLWELLPPLKWEVVGDGNFGADYVVLNYKNGSKLTIMSPLNSTRGQRATFGIIDEYRFPYRFFYFTLLFY